MVVEIRCQGCGSDMPGSAVTSFEDDGDTFYVCVDTDACEARRAGKAGKYNTTSFMMAAINRLTSRVNELEAWKATFGGTLGPAGTRPFLPGRPRRSGLTWDRFQQDTDPPDAS